MTDSASAPDPHHTGPAYVRLLLLGALIGIPAAALAAVFLGTVHELQHWLWTDLPDELGEPEPPWYLVLGLPVAGAAIVLVARALLPGDGGHEPLGALHPDPEPLCAIVGLAITSFARLDAKETRVIALAGSFAAISALFGGPLVAGVMMTESAVALGAALVPALLPGFVAAAVGYVIFVGFGDWGGLDTPGLVVPDLELYDGTRSSPRRRWPTPSASPAASAAGRSPPPSSSASAWPPCRSSGSTCPPPSPSRSARRRAWRLTDALCSPPCSSPPCS